MMREDKSELRSAEMLPGRVVNLLISPHLQETKSWPHLDIRKTFHTGIPVVLANFVRLIVSELGVEADSALDKRISHKFSDLAWKKGKREREKAALMMCKAKKRKHEDHTKSAKKTRVAEESSGNEDSDMSDATTAVSIKIRVQKDIGIAGIARQGN